MKKLFKKNRFYYILITTKRTKRTLHNRRKKKCDRRNFGRWDKIIKAPDIFSILGQGVRKDLFSFIEQIDHAIFSGKRRILLDFSSTKKMISDGTLLFRAHLCRLANQINSKHNKSTIKCKLSRADQKINLVLKQIGALELLDQNYSSSYRDSSVVHWRYAQGAGAYGEKYEEILGHYDGEIAETLLSGLYTGLTEAMTNTRQHAYPDKPRCNTESQNEWWMFSQRKDGYLYVTFCDLGIGIPVSLPESNKTLWRKLIEDLGHPPSDSRSIAEAVKYSRSRTEREHRGKGLVQLTKVIENTQNGTIYIFSNRGCYHVKNGKIGQFDHKDSIKGTLISWSLPIADIK